MPLSESDEHKRIKDLIGGKLKEWTGAALQEYPSSGHKLDVFAMTPDGISIYAEIIWSDSLQNFFRDMTMIQASDANVKLVVASPKILANEKCQRIFEKVAISQRKLGFAMHGDIIDGNKIIEDGAFLETELKRIVFEQMTHVQKYGKVVGKQAEVQLSEPRPTDNVEEQLLANLFPVSRFPSTIYSSPTDFRRVADIFARLGPEVANHPFLPKNRRLYTFDDLKNPSSIFNPIIYDNGIIEEQSEEWLRDNVKRNDLIYLLNLAFDKYCKKRNMHYDRDHDRFVCLLKDGKDSIFNWRAGSRNVSRKVARKVFGKDGKLLFCIHYAAGLRLFALDEALFLKIEPTKTFTSNGFEPIRVEKLASLMSRYLSKEFNSAYLSMVRFWAKYLSKLDVKITIPAGEQAIEIDTSPISVSIPVGIANEKVS